MALIYSAFILNILNLKGYKISFNTDSELMCKQINKEYKVSTSHIIKLFNVSHNLLKKLPNNTINHIYREHNTEADALANMAKNKGYRKIYLYY
jgi:ribonuclease HI